MTHLSAAVATLMIIFSAAVPSPARAAVQSPRLKWQYGGCYASWCETGWYAPVAVADLDGDGANEVIAAAYSLVVLDGESGSLKWRIGSGHDRSRPDAEPVGRTWPGVIVADLEGDGELEIVTAHSAGVVAAYDHRGYFLPGWPQHPAEQELRSLAAADLDGDGDLEIAVGRAELNRTNVWVYEHTGDLRSGWPRLAGAGGSAAGVYNDTIALGDLTGDGLGEVVVPSDTITICAYTTDGSPLATDAIYHGHPDHDMNLWGEVPAYVTLEYEIQGWGPCSSMATQRANFANGAANIVDVDGDGTSEVVVIGNVHDCHTAPYTDLYQTPYIFNADRTRFVSNGFDWQHPPVDTGAPLIQDYGIIESVQPNPVTVDLDGDGRLEILFASYDGRLHAFWLDGNEHHHWPYSVFRAAEGLYRFASEPAVADLDGDGTNEVIFASWVEKGSGKTGQLHLLDHYGAPLWEIDLPAAYGSPDWNGALAAPTLANIDGDPDLEVILNTAHSGVVAYDLPGSANARILWATGRGTPLRSGGITAIPSSPAPSDPPQQPTSPDNAGSDTNSQDSAGSCFLRTAGPKNR